MRDKTRRAGKGLDNVQDVLGNLQPTLALVLNTGQGKHQGTACVFRSEQPAVQAGRHSSLDAAMHSLASTSHVTTSPCAC